MVDGVPRLQAEALAAAAIEHPNVVPVYDAGVVDGVPFIAMRLIDGPSLAEVVAHGPLDVRRAVALIVQVASALEAAHARGVLHRDVKPANVLLDDDHAYVTDFGVAHRMTDPAVSVVGTVGYLAPEVLGGGPVDRRADVYSLGCTLVELLTGAPPPAPRVASAPADETLREAPAPPGTSRPPRPSAGASPRLRATAPRAGGRLAARALPAALADLVARTLSTIPPRGRRPPPSSPRWRSPPSTAAAPRAPTVGPRPGNLPMVAGRLIGRAIEFAALADACRAEGGIVSLVGPGGVGKTRLALAVADVVGADFEDGCFVVELESVGSAADVIGAIGRTLGLPDDALVERHLRGRQRAADPRQLRAGRRGGGRRRPARGSRARHQPDAAACARRASDPARAARASRRVRCGPGPARRGAFGRAAGRARARGRSVVQADGGERGRRRPHLRPARRAPAGVGARRPPPGPIRPGRAQLAPRCRPRRARSRPA